MEFDKKIKEKSKISIILPNYNSSKYIEETLSSILNQSFKDWRLIIIDDNSNFETKKILEKFKNNKQINIILLNKNKGAGYCRNLGIQISNSEYISFIDSDDTWEAEKLEEQFNFMEKNEYDFTYTQYSTFKMNNEKKILKKITPPKKMSYESFINDTSISTSSMMSVSRKVFAIRVQEFQSFLGPRVDSTLCQSLQSIKHVKFDKVYTSDSQNVKNR